MTSHREGGVLRDVDIDVRWPMLVNRGSTAVAPGGIFVLQLPHLPSRLQFYSLTPAPTTVESHDRGMAAHCVSARSYVQNIRQLINQTS